MAVFAAIVAVLLLAYLFAALLKPEIFLSSRTSFRTWSWRERGT